METRAYFVFGDVFANALTGVAAGWLTAAIVGPGWNMCVAMWLGMILGMVIAMVLSFAAFVWFFGAMEVMLPAMFTGMAAGMIVGMGVPMGSFAGTGAVSIGAVTGVAVVVFTYVLDAALSGKEKKWTR
jgi:hypothetical protein